MKRHFSYRQSSFLIAAVILFCSCAVAGAQQYFSHELRHAGDSTTFITLPSEPGKLETYFINLQDGDTVHSPFRVIFGVVGLGIAPAGVVKEGTGHHHLLIDTDMPKDLTAPIPFSDKYRHFGGGQTEAELSLPPGKHTLQLLFADASHRPLYKTSSGSEIAVFSKRITINVVAKPDAKDAKKPATSS